jgi:predicted permease
MMRDAGFQSVVVPLHARHVESVHPILLLLQAGAIVLLLIGLVNVGSLFLLRAGSRTKELAVRRALGARTSHIAAAILAETVLLSVAAAIVGLGLAAMGVALLGTLGSSRLPLGSEIALHRPAIVVAALAAMATGLLLGGAIALHHLANDPGEALRSQSRHGTASRHAERTRYAILMIQVALSFVLLASAALLASGVRELMRASPGFDSTYLLTAQVSLPWARYPTEASLRAVIDRLTAELAATPGLVASGIATNIPLSGNTMKSAATVAGRPLRPGEAPHGMYSYAVAGDFFAAMGVPLLEGRYLGPRDAGTAAHTCVVDEDFARRTWPSGGAIGQRLFLGSSQASLEEAYTIVGVVGAVKQAALSERDAVGAVYYPYSSRFDRSIYIVGRATVAPDSLQAAVRQAVRRIDPELPVNNARSMQTRIAESLVPQRSPAIFGGLFATIALLLTALGTYGSVSYTVAQRRREIGVRIALGARPQQVRAQFLGAGLRVVVAGMALGVAGAWAADKVLGVWLAGLPHAPLTALAVAAAVMAAVCVTACVVPASRAAHVSPIDVMMRD